MQNVTCLPQRTVEATIAFVDLAGFTALTETHGDLEAVTIVQQFRQRVLGLLGPGGQLVKTIGDAVMLAFTGPDIAAATLHDLVAVELRHHEAVLLPRAGAHHGSAVTVDGDYYGATVNMAARLTAEAVAGQFLATGAVARAAHDAGAVVTHCGPRQLRNVARPVELYEIHVAEPSDIGVDPVCHMRVPTSGPEAITLRYGDLTVHFCGLTCVRLFTGQAAVGPRRA